ncbi:MAG: radical SAM protein [Bacillota bacterium]|nr:radical SAM protein [Bacillota bacterium]
MSDSAHKAMFFDEKEGRVHCRLCPHLCIISDGQQGYCGVRENHGGQLISANYGMLTSINDDPVEKKPLFYFMPGTRTLSVGTFGCNMRCPFCQNSDISFGRPPAKYCPPESLVAMALSGGYPSISYTYNEPAIYYEYVYDTARLAHNAGVKNIMVTNGLINEEPLRLLLPHIDALNIDLKTMDEKKYRFLGGFLSTVQDTIRIAAAAAHVEVTYLAVPGISADLEQVQKAADFIASVDRDIPFHISRYFPRYKYHEPPTELSFLLSAAKLAKTKLSRVHVGNV